MPVESAADLAAFFDTDEFAVGATFTPAVGDPVSVSVILDQPDESIGVHSGADVFGQARMRVARAPASAFAAKPGPADTLTIAGTVYPIAKAPLSPDGGLYLIHLHDR